MTKLSTNSEAIAEHRYYLYPNEGWENLANRVGYGIAIKDEKGWGALFAEEIYNQNFLPAGRILRNTGRDRGSLLNCFATNIGDSIEEIGEASKQALVLWSEGGGLGMNLSNLRPKGAGILGKGGESSGPISFLKGFDAFANTIKSGGDRRAAGLAMMRSSHPDVFDFIDAKMVNGVISNFNISVGATRDFIDAVESDEEYTLSFKQKPYRTIKARELWDKLLDNMLNHAEPGLLFLDNLCSNNSYYFAPIVVTNPCGEAPLDDKGACCLGSLNVSNFVTSSGSTNWKDLEKSIRILVRFLDNVLDINKYPLTDIRIAAQNSRRIGCGIFGLAEYLFLKKVRYGSGDAVKITDRLCRFISVAAYEESIRLASERGAFPGFDSTLYSKANFIKKLPVLLRMDIKKHGIRNCTLLAMPPTGTTSLLADRTSGIEPLFAKAYRRDDRVSSRVYIHPMYKEILEGSKEIPSYFVDTTDLKPEDHLEMQRVTQQHTDGSVSKTINLPKDINKEEFSELLLEYSKDLKGVTCYRDGCRGEQPLNYMTEEEVLKYLETSTEVGLGIESVKCASGACEI